jgi:hypothetical protein
MSYQYGNKNLPINKEEEFSIQGERQEVAPVPQKFHVRVKIYHIFLLREIYWSSLIYQF